MQCDIGENSGDLFCLENSLSFFFGLAAHEDLEQQRHGLGGRCGQCKLGACIEEGKHVHEPTRLVTSAIALASVLKCRGEESHFHGRKPGRSHDTSERLSAWRTLSFFASCDNGTRARPDPHRPGLSRSSRTTSHAWPWREVLAPLRSEIKTLHEQYCHPLHGEGHFPNIFSLVVDLDGAANASRLSHCDPCHSDVRPLARPERIRHSQCIGMDVVFFQMCRTHSTRTS